MNKIVLRLWLLLITNSLLADCKIMTSPINLSKMTFVDSGYYLAVVPIVSSKTYKYTSFFNAYQDFDMSVRKYINQTICIKNKYNGVVNYKIQWQQTDKTYNFTATFDLFVNK